MSVFALHNIYDTLHQILPFWRIVFYLDDTEVKMGFQRAIKIRKEKQRNLLLQESAFFGVFYKR